MSCSPPEASGTRRDRSIRSADPRLPAYARDRPPAPVRAVPVRGHGPQGGRRRQRRHPRLDPAVARPDDQDPLLLQVKEAQPSVLEPYRRHAARTTTSGQRVVAGQRLMQATSDIFLGWHHVAAGLDGRRATSTCANSKTGKALRRRAAMTHRALPRTASACGWTLARAHARSGDRVAIASLPRQLRHLRPGNRDVRRDLRRPERTRLQGTPGRRRLRPHQSRARPVRLRVLDAGQLRKPQETSWQFREPRGLLLSLRPTSARPSCRAAWRPRGQWSGAQVRAAILLELSSACGHEA